MEAIFFSKGGDSQKKNKCCYLMNTKTGLSIAIRYFAGKSPSDIMQVHDVSLASVYYSVWGVIDAINTTESLAYRFPNHVLTLEGKLGSSHSLMRRCHQSSSFW